jgi:hypothetical protein
MTLELGITEPYLEADLVVAEGLLVGMTVAR